MYKTLITVVLYGLVVASWAMLGALLLYAAVKNHLRSHRTRQAAWAWTLLCATNAYYFGLRFISALGVYTTGSLKAQRILASGWGDIGLFAICVSALVVFYTVALAYPDQRREPGHDLKPGGTDD